MHKGHINHNLLNRFYERKQIIGSRKRLRRQLPR
jgi:hypothetical protein